MIALALMYENTQIKQAMNNFQYIYIRHMINIFIESEAVQVDGM